MQPNTSPPRAAAWHDDLQLGFGPIDRIHAEFVVLVDALIAASDDDMPKALDAVLLHCRDHFAAEEQWMAETGFPAAACHADEHAAVLGSVEGVQKRVATGDHASGRRLAHALADWFPGHADYLDSALAHWMCSKRLGGKPVVLRRSHAVHAQAAA